MLEAMEAYAQRCECEHAAHFEGAETDHPRHAYEDVRADRRILTIYGQYYMCAACAAAYEA